MIVLIGHQFFNRVPTRGIIFLNKAPKNEVSFYNEVPQKKVNEQGNSNNTDINWHFVLKLLYKTIRKKFY